jgi:hypothetical protein
MVACRSENGIVGCPPTTVHSVADYVDTCPCGTTSVGFRVEDLAGLLRGAGGALGDEVEEAGDVLEAGGGRGAGAEDANALPCDLRPLGAGPGAGHHRLVPEVVVDEVALAAAFVAFAADEGLAFEELDRFGDGRRADSEALDGLGRAEAARVGGVEAHQHPGHHLGQARGHEDGGERLLVVAHGLGVASVRLLGRLRPSGRGLPAPVGAAFGGAVGEVGTMQTFDTPTPISAVLDIPAGRVQFIAADRADTAVEVLATDASKGRDVKVAEQTTVEYSDGVLRVEASAKNQYFGPSGSIEVTVQLPAGSRVEVKAASAELRGVGQLGEVAFEGAHGPVMLDEAESVRLTTAAGDVSVGRLGGSAEISTQKGDIRIAEAVRGRVVLRTQAGAISIGAAPGVSAALDASTAYGRISNGLKNDGTAELDIHATTSYGDIVARSL